MMYLASFNWPESFEPLCIGKNKKKVHKRAYDMARELYGTGPVERRAAMCSVKIQMDDIHITKIEEVK